MRQLAIQSVQMTPQIVRASTNFVISVFVAEIIPVIETVDGNYLKAVDGAHIEVLELPVDNIISTGGKYLETVDGRHFETIKTIKGG